MSHVINERALKEFVEASIEIETDRELLGHRAASNRECLDSTGTNPALVTKIRTMLKTARKEKDEYTMDEVLQLVESMWDLY